MAIIKSTQLNGLADKSDYTCEHSALASPVAY